MSMLSYSEPSTVLLKAQNEGNQRQKEKKHAQKHPHLQHTRYVERTQRIINSLEMFLSIAYAQGARQDSFCLKKHV